MNIQEEVLEAQHQEWLKHPVTASYLLALKRMQDRKIKTALNEAIILEGKSESVRSHCISARTLASTLDLATDFNTLIEYLKKTNEN